MCTFNGQRFLRGQLESFLVQTRLPDELVVCDDGSTDATVDIMREFSDDAPFPVHLQVNDSNLGPTKNFEKAISACKGDVITLSDWDDIWMPRKLERLIDALTQSPDIGLVLSDANLIDEDGKSIGKTLWKARCFRSLDRIMLVRGANERILKRNMSVTYGGTMAFRSKFSSTLLPIPSDWLHDTWIGVVVAGLARVTVVNEPLMHYRQHSRNTSGAGNIDFTTRARLAGMNTGETFSERARRLHLAFERLSSNPAANPEFCQHLLKAEEHVLFRARIQGSRIGRAFPIAHQLLVGGYRRYSAGWHSAGADFFLR
ncbi:MAG: glycosyltransferase family 2 protein [Actinomycetota bacterium]|nr:glycosyltransferase family 2 protein [Actinomycetota bacterium]